MDSSMLLTMQPELLLTKRREAWSAEYVPDWLLTYLDLRPITDEKGVYDTFEVMRQLENKFSGLLEAAEHVVQTGQPINGFQTYVTDKYGEQRHITLDIRPSGESDGAPTVAVRFCDQPAPKISASSIDLHEVSFYGLIGMSQAMRRVFNKIRLYGVSDAPILVIGETGSGKEGVARAVHLSSKRKLGPFITLNCSAITETLFESELFGHEKGSFTSAIKAHKGRFERADKGTLFLDEIGDLPVSSQAKLLRVLEDQTIERVGGEKPIKVDVRLVAATNVRLEEAMLTGKFRADLYYRINALQIYVPPLRERDDDIELLIRHFIVVFNEKYGRHVGCLTRDAIQLLKQYSWPGNVRELRNLMERMFAENQGEVIGLRALREWYDERMNMMRLSCYSPQVTILPYKNPIQLGRQTAENSHNQGEPGNREQSIKRFEHPIVIPPAIAAPLSGTNAQPHFEDDAEIDSNGNGIRQINSSTGKLRQATGGGATLDANTIKKAFLESGGNITKAAAALGIHKATLYRRLKALNLTRVDLKS